MHDFKEFLITRPLIENIVYFVDYYFMKAITSIGYSIYTQNNSLEQIAIFLKKQQYSQFVVLCDENTFTHCLPVLLQAIEVLNKAEIIEIESGESSKNLEITTHIWQSLIDLNADKNSLLINLGGGVVSDLGGFVASVYKRGIDFINIPTSLLAMADASVGGKTGIDFSGIKNSIGTITQPQAVFVHVDFLQTLSNRHLKNGMAEVYKIALTLDASFWSKITSTQHALSIEQIITKSIQLKNNIVKKDPLEKGIRKVLNFGHTIGHAVESVLLKTKTPLLHGEAIIIGLVAESWISYHKKLISKTELNEITSTLINLFKPLSFDFNYFEELIKIIQQDKKNKNGKINCVLLNGIGNYQLDIAITPIQIEKALQFYNQSLS